MFPNLSVNWFLAFGTALMWHREKSFVSDDIDIGIFIDDLTHDNKSSKIIPTMKRFNFKLLYIYGKIDHGQGWTFTCPVSNIYFGIFVFYPERINETDTWWCASYNGRCNKLRYKKCRWRFQPFQLEQITLYEHTFQIVPISFIEEKYQGQKWKIPKKYGYAESLNLSSNLVIEY
ncbi:unnamed protein product [Didymodactylos carnosus]|uniref:LicD family protein n=1 Tax=Didymodactylos carnosus TaxID=1234261 RepID=A0A813YSJ9_9BILA|nr:unnamed protein product [Didymodactylos carnosus]CAF1292758.1 unnamed protein product [Didymodactylos carnosus]CAF3673026.1 unnamed protein product [Didymodactylos carnosus]CAF4097592.1 unnamed protein product [Didymodactylos carnosus]